MFAPFHYAFVQRGMLEALLLSIPAGILGTWIVLRGLAFFSHAVGTAAFPGLVLAAGLGWPGPAGAAVAVTAYTLGVESLASRRESNRETTTGLVLVGALALGVVLASDVFHSGANVETLLFGSLLLVGSSDVRLAAIAAAVTVLLSATLGRRWLAVGFERETASGPEASRFDPHWWHDPRNAEAAVRAIRATLVALDPSHRTGYRRRAAAYLAKLRALDRSLAACFARLPRSERKLVTDHDVAASYGGPVVVDGVTFELERGERIGILGPNGGGKSTLFRILLGELRPLRGTLRVPARLGFVPQTERSRLDYPASALDVALMGTLSRLPWWRPLGRRERQAAPSPPPRESRSPGASPASAATSPSRSSSRRSSGSACSWRSRPPRRRDSTRSSSATSSA